MSGNRNGLILILLVCFFILHISCDNSLLEELDTLDAAVRNSDIEIIQPGSGTHYVYEPVLVITGKVKEKGEIISLTARLNDNPVTVNGTYDWEVIITDLPPGIHHFVISMTNDRKDTYTAEASFTYIWEQAPSLISYRAFHKAVLLNNTIYVLGGNANYRSSDIEYFDFGTQTWHTFMSLNNSWVFYNAVTNETHLYLLGGQINSVATTQFMKIDPENREITLLSESPVSRFLHQLIYNNGKIYSFGGIEDIHALPKVTLDTCDVFNVLTEQWEIDEGFTLPVPLSEMVCYIVDDILYIVGGHDGIDYVSTVYTYTFSSEQWELMSTDVPVNYILPTGGYWNRNIYLIGGRKKGEKEIEGSDEKIVTYYTKKDVYFYNIDSGTWYTGTPMLWDREGAASVTLENTMYLIGGNRYLAANRVKHVEIYYPFLDAPVEVLP